MKKKNLMTGLLLLLIGIATFRGTYAYFASNRIATNVVTTGNIDIALQEYSKYDPEDPTKNEPWTEVNGIAPSQVVPKIVLVENTSEDQPAYIRVAVGFSGEDSSGKEITAADTQSLLKLYYNGKEGYNSANWLRYEDGGEVWYVYKGAVAADGKTEPLFDSVKFVETMGNDYMNAKFYLTVSAQGTQVKNNDSHGSDYTKIAGWPAN